MNKAAVASYNEWLKHQNPKLLGELEVVDPKKDLGDLPLLHISKDPKIKVFIPNVTRRTSEKEDRTTARVSMAPTLFGCISGYCSTLHDFNQVLVGESKAGWVIYSANYEIAVKPSRKLVDDVIWTDEHWLVGYSEEYREYPTIKLGKFYLTAAGDAAYRKSFSTTAVFIIETYHLPMALSPSVLLKPKSYYKLTMRDYRTHFNIYKYKDFKLEEITKVDYLGLKGALPDMLSDALTTNIARW